MQRLMATEDGQDSRIRLAVWLLPATFVVHDSEEILTMPSWIARHEPLLQAIRTLGPFGDRVVANLPRTTGAVARAVAVELIVLVIVTAWVTRHPRRGLPLDIYSALLGLFVGHSVTHVGLAILLRGYTPGVMTAVVLIPPMGVYLYRRLLDSNLVTWRTAIATAAVGMLAFLPVVLAAQYLGRTLSP
jgi:Protein of unknown function with HXXEE motif